MTPLLIQTCIPLAALILLGYVVGRLNTVDLKSIATIAIYAITPVVAFGSAARLEFTPSLVVLPFATFGMAAVVGLLSLWMGKFVVRDRGQQALLPVACGSGNTGYFGLPLAIALFGDEVAGLYFLANLGVVVFETSIGYYYIARGTLAPRDAFARVIRLPVLYALAAGLVFAALNLQLPEAAISLWTFSKGAYVVVGMMIAGIALAQAAGFWLDARLAVTALAGKFLLWPLFALLFALTDIFTPQIHQLIIVLSLAPVAANLPAYAAMNHAPVRDAALIVLVSTILAILALPVVLPILLN